MKEEGFAATHDETTHDETAWPHHTHKSYLIFAGTRSEAETTRFRHEAAARATRAFIFLLMLLSGAISSSG